MGDNGSGQAVPPTNLTSVIAVGAGEYHSLALKENGTVVAWGENNYGQTNVPSGLTNVVAIAAGGYTTAALKNDGTVVAWGDNTSGQTNVLTNLPPIKSISVSSSFVLATPFTSLVQYQVDPSKDLLLIYNTNSPESTLIKN